MLKGSTIRVWRGQTDAPSGGKPDPKPIAVKKAWGELRGHITSMMVWVSFSTPHYTSIRYAETENTRTGNERGHGRLFVALCVLMGVDEG